VLQHLQPSCLCGRPPRKRYVSSCSLSTSRFRPIANPNYAGKPFGATRPHGWAFPYNTLTSPSPQPREWVAIYEVYATASVTGAKRPSHISMDSHTDPSASGINHRLIRAVSVRHSTIRSNHGILKNVFCAFRSVRIRRHRTGAQGSPLSSIRLPRRVIPWQHRYGAVAMAPMYYPSAVAGGLLSVGDSHAARE